MLVAYGTWVVLRDVLLLMLRVHVHALAQLGTVRLLTAVVQVVEVLEHLLLLGAWHAAHAHVELVCTSNPRHLVAFEHEVRVEVFGD